MKKNSISAYSVLLIIIIMICANHNIQRWKNNNVIVWDIIGYYGYLPSTFIYHDFKLNFLNQGLKLDEEVKLWPIKAPNGNYLHKYSMGMAVMYAPFFFVAHIQSQFEGLPTNGFSWYYQKYIHLSCLFYLIIGLFFLRRLLIVWFKEWAVALSLITIVIGTNLFFYATSEAAMSHAYSFSLAAVFMYAVHRWYEEMKWKHAILIGISLGLMILIRPVNIVFVLFPLLYRIDTIKNILENIRLALKRPFQLMMLVAIVFLIILPQLLYWKSVTGKFLFFSYVGERFNFLKPMILDGMLSFRNGWLIYSPVMIASLIGIYFLFQIKSIIRYAVLCILLINIYIVFSWWCWWYVGYGNRAMIDMYSLLAIPMAAFYQHFLSVERLKKSVVFVCMFLLISLNLFQTLQYRMGLIHYDGMTFKAYIGSFGKLNYTEDYKSGIQSPDYEKEKAR